MSPVLLVGRMSVPDELDAKFNDAYNNERLPLCLSIPGYIRARRWEVVMGSPKYATVHEMESLEVAESEGWRTGAPRSRPSGRTRCGLIWFTRRGRRVCIVASSRSSVGARDVCLIQDSRIHRMENPGNSLNPANPDSDNLAKDRKHLKKFQGNRVLIISALPAFRHSRESGNPRRLLVHGSSSAKLYGFPISRE